MKKIIFLLLFPAFLFAQNNFDRVLKGGEILVNGLSFLKKKEEKSNAEVTSTTIGSICVKNKLTSKITFILTKESVNSDDIKKELVVRMNDTECVFTLPKGIYNYEVKLPDGEIYKKGEYHFEEEIIITIKNDKL